MTHIDTAFLVFSIGGKVHFLVHFFVTIIVGFLLLKKIMFKSKLKSAHIIHAEMFENNTNVIHSSANVVNNGINNILKTAFK